MNSLHVHLEQICSSPCVSQEGRGNPDSSILPAHHLAQMSTPWRPRAPAQDALLTQSGTFRRMKRASPRSLPCRGPGCFRRGTVLSRRGVSSKGFKIQEEAQERDLCALSHRSKHSGGEPHEQHGHCQGGGSAAGEQGEDMLGPRPSRYGLHALFSAHDRTEDSIPLLLREPISKRQRKS